MEAETTNKCSKCNELSIGLDLCIKHYQQDWREKNPIRYAYHTLKGNAKRRNKEFYLTYSQFRNFCNETGYIEMKGKSATSFSIDRINCEQGYHINNIRVLTLSSNGVIGAKPEPKWNIPEIYVPF